MPKNIFLLESPTNSEDRLTFIWSWMLNVIPDLGQVFSDYVADRTGLPKSTFQTATDHPTYRVSDFPDMLLSTDAWQVLFEHKLSSAMNTDQLERYLRLAGTLSPITRLAFMSRDVWSIDPKVKTNPLYLQPAGADHFLWSDIYPLVVASRSPACIDFEHYLTALGLRPENWGGIGDPFSKGNNLAKALVFSFSQKLKTLGWNARKPPANRWYAVEIRTPMPKVHLAYLKLEETIGSAEPRLLGKTVLLILWTKPQANERLFFAETGRLEGGRFPIYHRSNWKSKFMGPEFKGELFFTASMKDVLGESYGSALDGLSEFFERSMTWAQEVVASE